VPRRAAKLETVTARKTAGGAKSGKKTAGKKAARKKTARQKSAARKRLSVSKQKRGLEGDAVLLDLASPTIAPLAEEVRFAGGAYSSFLKKVDRFSDRTLAVSLRERAGYAARLSGIDVDVKRIIAELQERGFKSPYLRNYVVARINPVRFHRAKKGDTAPPMAMGAAFTRMAASARKFDTGSVSEREVALVAAVSG
jgi:hypothetical protein